MRDNDNIYLGKVRGELVRAVNSFRARGSREGRGKVLDPPVREAIEFLKETAPVKEGNVSHGQTAGPFSFRTRQIVGQPSGPGIGRGRARVMAKTSDLFSFRSGEVLVCDAIDPSMTIVVPLAAGIVERRGGMLIHGAIIAREYGIPCVTGIPDATEMIHTGDSVTVDGYLGIVIIG